MNCNSFNTSKTNFRYERKFLIDNPFINNLEDLKSFLSINLNEQYQERRINSIYYDTYDYKLSKYNLEGITERQKIRVRYYDSISKIDNPKLEIKSKYGLTGKKDIYNINKNDLLKNLFCLNKLNLFINPNNKNYYLINSTEPKIIISYLRKYFISSCKKYRFTLDSNLIFKKFDDNNIESNFANDLFLSFEKKILEIKYSIDHEDGVSLITQKLPLRLSTVSKYLISLNSLGLSISY